MSKRMGLLLATVAIVVCAGTATAQDGRGDRNQPSYGNGYNYGYDDGYARRDRNDRYRPDPYRRDVGYKQGAYYYGRDCSNNAAAGALLGAVVGGLIGNSAGRGNGGAVVGGVILGGLVGNTIASNMNCDDRRVAMASYGQGFNGRVGQRHRWRAPDGQSYGSFTPTREYSRNGNVCRDFREAGYSNGQSYNRTGTACRHNDGNWYTD
ncbi:RT0821/Lpp0805 family surface protein [Rhizomicrobium electricum]|nr:RT0821/Lpp0805 family surface protein [Rhizomicrobium electricum]NIJ47935.1 surface antigen [Rhizomicrobium electricum]